MGFAIDKIELSEKCYASEISFYTALDLKLVDFSSDFQSLNLTEQCSVFATSKKNSCFQWGPKL